MNFLVNLKLNHKLLGLLILPILCLLYFSGQNVWKNWTQANELQQIARYTQLSVKMSSFLHETQKERGMTSLYLTSHGTKSGPELQAQRSKTDTSLGGYQAFLKQSVQLNTNPELKAKLDKLAECIQKLPQKRSAVSSFTIKPTEAIQYYTQMNQQILDTVFVISEISDNRFVSSGMRSYLNLLKGKEYAGLERANLAAAFTQNTLTEEKFFKILSIIGNEDKHLELFEHTATTEEKELYESLKKSTDTQNVINMRNILLLKNLSGDFSIDPVAWFQSATVRINVLKDVEDKVAHDLLALAVKQKGIYDHAFLVSVAIAIIGLSSAILAIIMANYLTDTIVSPLKQCVHFTQKIADGDLTGSLRFNRKDEIGQLSQALNAMVDNLRELTEGIKLNASSVASASEELSATANQMQGNADQASILSSSASVIMEQLDGNLKTVAAAVAQSSSSIQEVCNANIHVEKNHMAVTQAMSEFSSDMQTMSSMSEEMSNSVNAVVTAIEEMTASLSEVGNTTSQATSMTATVEGKAIATKETITQLGNAAQEIGSVIEMIKNIASQTNLLALNATIEAASAGEAGKGFAVVANEVKELAKQSAEATEDIKNRVEKIQNSTQTAVLAINEISESIGQINLFNTTIASAVEEQTATINEINHNAVNVAKTVNEVSSTIHGLAQKTHQVAEKVQEAGVEVKQISNNLEDLTKGTVDISKNSTEASQGASEMSRSIIEVSVSSKETSQGATAINQTATQLSEMATSLESSVNRFKV